MTSSTPRLAFIDANVLYQSTMRDVLLQAAADRVFRMRWSLAVREEVMRAFRRRFSAQESVRFERYTMARIDNRFSANLVHGYEAFATTFRLPDPDDRHVLAAAVQANCQYLVTQNLRDFPAEVCARYGIEVAHPDDFLLMLLEREEGALLQSLRTCRMRMQNPPMDTPEYLAALRRAKLPNFADALEARSHRLA